VQGAWWPHTDQLLTELPTLLGALTPRLGQIDHVIFDETYWTPTSLRMEFMGRSILLEGSAQSSTNTLTVIGEGLGKLVLLVVPPYTKPARAYTAVMTASKPDDVSRPDELLGIGQREAQDRRRAVLAHQRWLSEGRVPGRLDRQRGIGTVVEKFPEVRNAQWQ
jgi:hypothetical protein